ncbi:B3/B4 domain-containing protein [Brevibacillus dissolubilis]|uniref:B3/B4 domain-containing protein n=1 Tax=Brevibacillus dissolubilis TaxID=1844116 RepID=UPI001116CF21|nr:phenylalanine--tRNA ligase beta subunit-related protein [Brevibacillus dissolubilis]
MNVKLDTSVLERLPELSLGVIQYAGMTLSESPKLLQGRINLFLESLRVDHELAKITEIPGVLYWRAAFKQLGIDPSRYRPSSEALLRRVLQGNTLHWLHTAVDVNNFLSVRYALPFGIYNQSQISGPITCRLGTETDIYPALNGREINMNGKLLLADDHGAFGSPIVDSVRTSVDDQATNLIHVIFFHHNIAPNEREEILGSTARMMTEINGGDVVFTGLVTNEG